MQDISTLKTTINSNNSFGAKHAPSCLCMIRYLFLLFAWILCFLKNVNAVIITTFDSLSQQQKQIHGTLIKETLSDLECRENRFCVAVRLMLSDNSEKIFIIKDCYKNCIGRYRARNVGAEGTLVRTHSFRSSIYDLNIASIHCAIIPLPPRCHDECATYSFKEEFKPGTSFPLDFATESTKHGLTDSEYRFIAYFCSEKDSILHEIFSKLEHLCKIKSIELHGFTLRDMCDNCYRHMSYFCHKFKDLFPELFSEQAISFYISSLLPYEHTYIPIEDVEYKIHWIPLHDLKQSKDTGTQFLESITNLTLNRRMNSVLQSTFVDTNVKTWLVPPYPNLLVPEVTTETSYTLELKYPSTSSAEAAADKDTMEKHSADEVAASANSDPSDLGTPPPSHSEDPIPTRVNPDEEKSMKPAPKTNK